MHDLLLEHESIPGTVYENRLFMGDFGCASNEIDLFESTDGSGSKSMRFRGKFQEANAINKNKRMYPKDVLDENVKRLAEVIENGGLIGELDHPTDSILHFNNAALKVEKLWWQGNVLMGEGTILNTPCGKILKALIADNVRWGISSRGVGNGKVNEEGILVIGESYKLITFDAVADPSTHAAFQEKVVSNRRESVNYSTKTIENSKQNPQNSVKNESSSIANINPQLVLACFSGIVRKQASDIKARLS